MLGISLSGMTEFTIIYSDMILGVVFKEKINIKNTLIH